MKKEKEELIKEYYNMMRNFSEKCHGNLTVKEWIAIMTAGLVEGAVLQRKSFEGKIETLRAIELMVCELTSQLKLEFIKCI